jgi:hypothetical protein
MNSGSSRLKRFAFVTDELPQPNAAGHLAMNWALITHLAALGHAIEILLIRPRLPKPVMRWASQGVTVSGPRLLRAGRWMIASEPRAAFAGLTRMMLPGRLVRGMRQASGEVDAVLGAFPTPTQIEWCAAHLAALHPDAILIDTIFRAPILDDPRLVAIPSLIIAHDVFHRRHAALRLAGYRISPASLNRQDEAALLEKGGALAAIQEDEAALLAKLCPDKPVITAPMPAIPCPRTHDTRRDPQRLVFVGSDSLPNLDGLNWFLGEVWPRLTKARPGITLDLVGDAGTTIGAMPPGVRRLGRQPDMAPFLHRAALAIAPLRVGSGLKIKLLDYARHGLWTVATPPSLEGFARDKAAPFIRAEAPENFAITRHYGPNAVFAPLRALLNA